MLSFDVALLIANLLPISDPIYSIFTIFLRKSEWFESIAKKWFFFHKINNVDFNLLILFCISNLEVKPLIMASCVDVVLQNKVICLNGVSFIIIFVYV